MFLWKKNITSTFGLAKQDFSLSTDPNFFYPISPLIIIRDAGTRGLLATKWDWQQCNFFYTVQMISFNSALVAPGKWGKSWFVYHSSRSFKITNLPLGINSEGNIHDMVSCAVVNEPRVSEDFMKQAEQMEIIFSHYWSMLALNHWAKNRRALLPVTI